MCDAGNGVGTLVTRAQEVGTVEGSLYERLGGVEAITAVVRAFDGKYSEVLWQGRWCLLLQS